MSWIVRDRMRLMSIDCSTKTVAFAIWVDGTLDSYGEIEFKGDTAHERLADAARKMAALREVLHPEVIVIESAVSVRSTSVVIKLAYVYGAVLGGLVSHGTEIYEVEPVTWQSYIGNPLFNRAQKAELKQQFPGKTAAWYRLHIRELRKQKTIELVDSKFGVSVTSDNVGDAIGVGWYALEKLV